MSEVKAMTIERYRTETGATYGALCDAALLLNEDYGNKGFNGTYVGPSPEARAKAQADLERLRVEFFEDTVVLFRTVGGAAAMEAMNALFEQARLGRKSPHGYRYDPPFERDVTFLERVLIAVTGKESAEGAIAPDVAAVRDDVTEKVRHLTM